MDNNDDAASSAADQATGVAGKSSGGPASDKYYEKANCDQILLPVFHGDVGRILRVLQEASSYIFADMRYDNTQSTDTTKITKDCTR